MKTRRSSCPSSPDPLVYKITREFTMGNYLVIEATYPNCTNYEGKKILLYNKYRSSAEVLAANNGELDPHFSEKGPIARFSPGTLGRLMLATLLMELEKT